MLDNATNKEVGIVVMIFFISWFVFFSVSI